MIIGTKIFLIGCVIGLLGRIMAEFNDEQGNRVWIGSIVLSGLVLATIGGITWIITL